MVQIYLCIYFYVIFIYRINIENLGQSVLTPMSVGLYITFALCTVGRACHSVLGRRQHVRDPPGVMLLRRQLAGWMRQLADWAETPCPTYRT